MTIKQILTGVRDWINNKFATKASVNTALAAKQDKLVSGTNIKTINKQSLLGSGNITIQGGGGGDADMAAVPGESGYIANKLGGYAIPVEDDDFAVEVSPTITLYQGDYYVAIPESMVKEWRNGGVIMQLIAAGKSLVAWANPDDENVKGDIWYSPEDGEIQFRVDEPLEDEDLGIFQFEIANLADSEVEFMNKDGEIEIQSAVVVPLPSSATPDMQPKLVSGSNIKTINNTSILGSGNINIDADTTDCVKVVSQPLTTPQKTQARTNVDAVGSQTIENIIELTQAEYDALTTKDPTAIYVVTDTSPSTESQNVGIANIETESSSVSGGTNVITITLTNGESYDIPIKNGEQGNSGYSGAAGELEVVNNLTDGGATAALSAAQGVVLDEKIVKTGLKNIDLNDYVEITTIAGGSGKWVTDSANYPYKSKFFACSPNDRFFIVSAPTQQVTYCFLTAPNYVNNTNVDYATGYSGNGKKTPAGGGMIVAPSDATYLYIMVKNTSGVYIGPTSIGVESNAQSVADAAASEAEADINLRLDGQEVNITDGKYLNSSGAEVTDANFAYTDYIPITQGDMVNWTSGTTASSPRLVAYDSSKSVLGTYTPTKTIRVTNTGVAYIRASYRKGQGITMPVAINSKKAFTIVASATTGLEGRIEALETAEETAKSFSSFIPFRETYENYMSISDAQGAAIYGNYLATWVTGNKLNIYDLSAKTLVQQLTLPTFPNTRTHANTLSFGAQKYNEADLFPCLYLCSGYTTTAGSTDSQVYVLRLSGSLGSLSASLVQTITLDMGAWTEFVVDPVKDVAWINGSGVATYICVAVPSVTDGDVTITPSSTIIDQFNVPKIVLGLSTKSSGQGRFFYHGRVYYVSGVPQYPDEGQDALCLVVDNTLTHCTEAIVALKNFGLTAEPEACIVWNNDFYVVYPSFLAKLIQ